MGYPDIGAGYYSRTLPYKDWYKLNCTIRVHSNNLEHLVWTIPCLFLSGIFFPRLTTGFGMIILLGREFYRYGYFTNDGPNSLIREIGAYSLNISELLIAFLVCGVAFRYKFGKFIS